MKIFKNKNKNKDGVQDRLLTKLGLFVFDRPRIAALLWLAVTIFGIVSYTTLLKREGFPSINIPYSVISGTYFVNDAGAVDSKITKPISDIALKDSHVKSVQSGAHNNYYSVVVQYQEGADANAIGKQLQSQIQKANIMPSGASLKVETPKIGFSERGDDGVVSVYAKNGKANQEQLVAEGNKVAEYIKSKNFSSLQSVSVIDPFVEGSDVISGLVTKNQTSFDRYGERIDGSNKFYDSVSVGYAQKKGTDVVDLSDKITEAVNSYNQEHQDSKYVAVVSASYADSIREQIGGLQQALLEGLLAVLIVGSLVIAIRASIITVLAMLSVLTITLGILYAIGYTLNTITLFSLVLCLGLIVDDTIIMVEAIDAQRRKRKDPREAVEVATRKVSRAMVAATSTAVLSFAPLLFVGGILGSFIRAIPVTVITSLIISLVVALVFIPLFARYLMLGKKQMGAKSHKEPAAGIEAKVAAFVGKPMLWARGSLKKMFGVGSIAVVIGLGFIVAAGFLFQKVAFNIFPPSKDSNGITLQLKFNPDTTIDQAEGITDRANEIVARELGDNFKSAAYYNIASTQSAQASVYLISYKDRAVTAPQLTSKLEDAFKGFDGASVQVAQQDVGPPASAFNVRVVTDDREAALKLAKDVKSYLTGLELTRTSGEKAKVITTSISDPSAIERADGDQYIDVSARFDGTDTTTLMALAQDAVKKEFNESKLASYGLNADVLNFDLGMEEDNQNSFGTLLKAFPILLLIIFVLLAVQFRSLLQPILIFMAIPFSLFGIALGLYLTDNSFSFFTMLGFFALLGLSIKNTILLTDYANQLRRAGESSVDAAVGALRERFRPLIATSFTAVVSLIPLYLSDPFWEGLTVVLIFGLLSSTFLVVTVFPYYYLGAEFLRTRTSRGVKRLFRKRK